MGFGNQFIRTKNEPGNHLIRHTIEPGNQIIDKVSLGNCLTSTDALSPMFRQQNGAITVVYNNNNNNINLWCLGFLKSIFQV